MTTGPTWDDTRALQAWQSVSGPNAKLNGPLIRFAHVMRRDGAADALVALDATCAALRTRATVAEAERARLDRIVERYVQAARVIGLRLVAFCDETLPYDEMIAEASRRAAAEIALLKGAMAAQDERERQAGELCGVSAAVHGCDWPDAVADTVLALRSELALTKT